MAKQKLSKEEKKRIRKEQRQKDALHSYRFRGFKNFLFWLAGVLTCIVLIVSSVFIGVAVVPVRVYFGDSADQYVSKDVSSKSLLNAILKANTYDMTDFPLIAEGLDSLVKSANLDEYVEIDVEKMKTLKFDENFTTELQSCIKVVATLDSVGGMDLIGDIGNLEILSNWEEVQTESLPTTDVDGNITKDEENGELTSNPKLYYYYHVETEGASSMSTKFQEGKGEWRRAFDDDGKRVPESVGQKLYYANISQVPILDVVDLIDETLGRLKLADLLTSFGGAELGDTSLIGNLLGDKTISQIGDITAEDISLTAILPYKDTVNNVDNSELYKILLQICGAEIKDWDDDAELEAAAESLNINSFGNLSFENVALATFLPYEDNAQIYKILLQICGAEIEDWDDETQVKAAAESLNINSFGSLSFENISLTTFLPYEDNADIYEILLKITGAEIEDWDDETQVKAAAESLNINSFGSLSFENISLTTFLPYEGNADIYVMLLKITGAEIEDWDDETQVKAAAENLNISSFESLDLENISLTTFLPYEDNVDTYKMLLKITGAEISDWDDDAELEAAAESLNINSFGSLDLENISLTTFLPYEDNADLYKILLQACGTEINDWDDATEVKAEAEKLSINSFNDVDFNNISIDTFNLDADTAKIIFDAVNKKIREDNENLKPDETPKDELEELSDLRVGHLTMLDPNYITLSSLLPYSSNADMYKIILQACGNNLNGLEDYEIETLANSLTIDSFGSLDFNNISISTFGLEDEMLNLIYDAVNAKIKADNENLDLGETEKPLIQSASDLTVGHLTTLDTNYITLSSVLPYSANKDMYNIILQACGNDLTGLKDDEIEALANSLNISAFNDVDFNNVSISTFGLGGETLTLLYDTINAKIKAENDKKLEGEELTPLLTSESQLTVGHLVSLDVNYIKLSSILPYSSNADMYKLILQASGKSIAGLNDSQIEALAKELDVNAFSSFDMTKITLNTVLPANDANNKGLYDILLDVINGKTGTKTAEQITIADLSGFSINNVKLSTVLPYEDADKNPINTELYNILMDAINGDDNSSNDVNSKGDITLNHLDGFEFNGVKLNTVLPVNATDKDGNKVNEGLYKILLDVVNAGKLDANKKTAEEITILDLSNFEINNIKLSTVLPYEDAEKQPINTALYSILLDVVNGDSGTKTAKDLKLSDLTGFSYENMHLSTILTPEENASLYNVLCDVLKVNKEDLKLSHLSLFDVSKIHLQTVLGDKATGNVILDKLIEKDVEISNLASAINGLSLYEIYGQNCFTAYAGETGVARYEHNEGDNSFKLNPNGQFVISDKAGIWLFLCFDSKGVKNTDPSANDYGCAEKYTISEATFKSLTEEGSGNNLSKQLTNATIRQLVDAGVLESANPLLYTLTLQDAVAVRG